MSEKAKRLTDADVTGHWYTLEHNESPGLLKVSREWLRADHLQAREDVKLLAAALRVWTVDMRVHLALLPETMQQDNAVRMLRLRLDRHEALLSEVEVRQ